MKDDVDVMVWNELNQVFQGVRFDGYCYEGVDKNQKCEVNVFYPIPPLSLVILKINRKIAKEMEPKNNFTS